MSKDKYATKNSKTNRVAYKTILINAKDVSRDIHTSIQSIENKMNKITRRHCWFILLNVLLFATDIILLSIFLPRQISDGNLHFDYIGAIVGIVAILVAIIMSWNIYTVIDMRNIKSDTYSYIEDKLTIKINDLAVSLACYSDTLSVNSEMILKDPDYAIDILIETIDSCYGKQYSASAINGAITKLGIICCKEHKNDLTIFENRKQKYIKILSQFDSKYVLDIIDRIKIAKEEGESQYSN